MMPPALNISQFAEYIETIKMLYKADDDFKTLCDDYATSRMNMEKYKGKTLQDMRSELNTNNFPMNWKKKYWNK